jgi:hypothetical protein
MRGLLFTASLAIAVSAQTAAENATAASIAAKVPACALPCDQQAITQVGYVETHSPSWTRANT